MPSTLVFHGYKLHQIINNYQLPGFPIRWCHLKRKWIILPTKDPFLKASISVKALSAVFACYIIFLTFYFPHSFQIVHKFVPIVLICFIGISILIDLIFLLNATEIIDSCNWCIGTEILQFYRERDLYLSKSFKLDTVHLKIKLIKYTGKKQVNFNLSTRLEN